MTVLLISLSIIRFFVITVEIPVMVTATHFIETAWDSILSNAAYDGWTTLQLLLVIYDVLSAGHQNLDCF